jgi:uncharacterized phage protein gp47/JayE
MPNQLTAVGLEIKTFDEIYGTITSGLQSVYGADINVDQSSPDGQLVNIFVQAALDNLETLVDVYNSFSPYAAYGVTLDQRMALNGITRKQGTYTMQIVEITVDRALTLPGLDAEINNPDGTGFTVQDDQGNQFILAATQIIPTPGTYPFTFRSKVIGRIETTANTITNQTTLTLGVTAVNNPSSYTALGENEETDLELRTRHSKSFNLAATGPADAIEAAIMSVSLVTDTFVAENDTGSTDHGVPAHSIWAIVENGADSDIGQAIYSKKTPGCGMKGSVSVVINRPNGTTFTDKFDRPLDENLHIRFTMIPKIAGVTFDTSLDKAQLVDKLKYTIAQSASIGDVIIAMLAIEPNAILTSVAISNNGSTWVEKLDVTDYQHKFVLDVSRIAITV